MSPRLEITAGVLVFALGLVLANTLPISERHQYWVLGALGAIGGILFFEGLQRRRRRK